QAPGVPLLPYTPLFRSVSASGAYPEAPAGLFRDKGLGAKAVAESGVPYVIVRPGRYMRDWIGFLIGAQAQAGDVVELVGDGSKADRKSTRLNSSHVKIS